MKKYKLEKTDYGLKMILSGDYTQKDFVDFHNDFVSFVLKEIKPTVNFKNNFKVLIDASGLGPFNGFGTSVFRDCQNFLLNLGVKKSAKILSLDFQKLWASIISSNTETEKIEKYFDNEKDALEWLLER